MAKKAMIVGVGILGVILIIALAGFIRFNYTSGGDKLPSATTTIEKTDPKNISYNIEGTPILLLSGKADRVLDSGSASRETFATFGEPTIGDIDGDGDADAAMYLVRSGGGSGMFFYVIVAINNEGSYQGTNALFLGDRIAPQNIRIENGTIIANFAERKNDEPFTVAPSVGKSVSVHLDPDSATIGEVVQNFEGEADVNRMTLSMKTWLWIHTDYATGVKVAPKQTNAFTITIKRDGTFSATTDCNGAGGAYMSSKSGALTFNNMMSMMMYCEGSEESKFTGMLGAVAKYHFTSKGELIMELKDGKGAITFR